MCATDGRVSLFVQCVVRHVVLLNILPDLRAVERGNGAYLEDLVLPIPIDGAEVGAGARLTFAQACDPDVVT